MKHDFDAIVIGAGAGGLTTSIGLRNIGKKVLLVEKHLMGGDCTNVGCIPSKTLIHHAQKYATALEYGGNTAVLETYRNSILEKVRTQVIDIRDHESPDILEHKFGLTVVIGEASFVDTHTVQINTKDCTKNYTAKKIIIATGSSPRIIDIVGLRDSELLTNKTLFDLVDIPKKLIIIGGGAIGCEMAEAFALLGTTVTMVVRSTLLRNEQSEVVDVVRKELNSIGVTVLEHSKVESCEQGTARIHTKKEGNDIAEKYGFEYVLFAIGRIPNISGIGLEKVGIECSKKDGIITDHNYRTTVKNIFAVGDVIKGKKFTHVADDQGRFVAKKILFPFVQNKKKPIPRVTFLRKEIATTGLISTEAEKKFGEENLLEIQVPFSLNDRAITDQVTNGLAIVTVRRLTGKIVGASIVGKNAGEIISFFTLAIQQKISLWRINAIIFPYPVLGLIIKKASDQFVGVQIKNLKQDIICLLKNNFTKIFAIAFWGIIVYSFYTYKSIHDLGSLDIARSLYQYFTTTAFGPFLYILVYAIRPLIFFPATLLTLLSGALFGPWIGILYTIVGENMSANFAYFLGRFFGQGLIPESDDGVLTVWKSKLQKNSFVSVLIMRVTYLPFDLVNYGCGIFKVRWRDYFIATLVGTMPGLVTFVSLGASIDNIEEFDPSTITIDTTQLFISGALFLLSLSIAKIVRKKQKTKKA